MGCIAEWYLSVPVPSQFSAVPVCLCQREFVSVLLLFLHQSWSSLCAFGFGNRYFSIFLFFFTWATKLFLISVLSLASTFLFFPQQLQTSAWYGPKINHCSFPRSRRFLICYCFSSPNRSLCPESDKFIALKSL